MRESMEFAAFFAAQLNPETPCREALAGAAMVRVGRVSCLRRSEACDRMIVRGTIACVLSGAVRKFALRPEGQRQIVDLALSGEYLGFAPADPGFFLEAVSNETLIISFSREQIDQLSNTFPAVAALIQLRAGDAIRRLEYHLLIQNRITAREKVGAYLAEMSRRVEPCRKNAIVLPITRYDIADHLGIAVETVSRAMTALCRCGSIALASPRDVEIRDASMFVDFEFSDRPH